jgi:hypothetical protein
MLKYNIRKRKHWVHPFFCDDLNWSAYIVSKELNLDPDSFVSWEILSQAVSIPDEVIGFFSWPNLSSRIMNPGVDSASNRNEYQVSSWAKGRPVH